MGGKNIPSCLPHILAQSVKPVPKVCIVRQPFYRGNNIQGFRLSTNQAKQYFRLV